ncbi:vegetative cell wall protein gp1 [Trichoplusia ni]|uniref:Vegetative cell wall protein gp1 n=1 Tax=Trichoplusia ni TaxID=7111 RepID=A0A7E5VVS4_TRINI|nr:vegetative cell wall protein gp1 [Trichoplusia ni]XP_026732434.1 vegetative cell wall protein gp1 [Trichoplusia ni]XP_026732435.1 vegetative cell wall protein gp1 [Trichoplusia ni]
MRARAWSWWAALLLGAVGARELDPAACAPRFDVQHDKIIRTEESREMGARYLSELDVGARHECLRLCCETDSCDVFVYEEKGPGSCYLFNCGPPEDFRCKFTAHSNFSSGVLAISRRLAELQDQERLAHHEQELANLRSGTSSTASTSAASTAPPRRTPPPPAPPTPPSRCSRYQFECRRGGECIAVYNACDGVAQCADGSDEAPELGCPAAARAPAPPPPERAPAPPPSTPRATAPPAQDSAEAAVADVLPPDERWPHRLTQAQPQHRYNEAPASSHIFSHKGGLLQEPEAGAQFPPFEPPWPRRPWPQQQPTGLESMSGERGWGGAYWPEPDPRRAWPVPRPDQQIPVYVPPKTMPEIPVMYTSQQQTLRDSPKKGFELMKKEGTEHPRAAEAALPEDKAAPAAPTAAAKPAADQNVQVNKPAENLDRKSLEAAHEHYRASDEQEGLSEHPPAAMMLLVIGEHAGQQAAGGSRGSAGRADARRVAGLGMLTAMAALLVLRRRAARRRRGRGRSPFAHDADYLVNGMYL